MGYYCAIGPCAGCKRLFSFNPLRVPSVVIEGTREPICAECVERANPLRAENGLEPIAVLPGAYEAADEGEFPE